MGEGFRLLPIFKTMPEQPTIRAATPKERLKTLLEGGPGTSLAYEPGWDESKVYTDTPLGGMSQATVIPGRELLRRLLNLKGTESYTPAMNTVRNFIIKTIKEDNTYWKQAELVPTIEPYLMREVNRNIHPKYTGHVKEVEDMIKEGITTDYPVAFWNPKTNYIHLGEGNTRTGIAYEKRLPALPLRIIQSGREGHALGIQAPTPVQPNQFGYIPSNLKPSQLGIDYFDIQEILDLIKGIK